MGGLGADRPRRNHLQLMVGSGHKNIFPYKRMRKENRTQGSGGK
jgi:hypothetical protein